MNERSACKRELITDDGEHRLGMRLPHADKRAIRPIITDQPWVHVIQTWQGASRPASCHTMQHTPDQASIFRPPSWDPIPYVTAFMHQCAHLVQPNLVAGASGNMASTMRGLGRSGEETTTARALI